MKSHSSIDKKDIAVGASCGTFDHAWNTPALVQSPPSLDVMHKCIRWALASSREGKASTTLFIMPDSSSSQHQQYDQYHNYYNLGTMLVKRIAYPQYWNREDRKQEGNLSNKMQFKARVILIANDAGIEANFTTERWENFRRAIREVANTEELRYPTLRARASTEPAFKAPKAFINLLVTPTPNDLPPKKTPWHQWKQPGNPRIQLDGMTRNHPDSPQEPPTPWRSTRMAAASKEPRGHLTR